MGSVIDLDYFKIIIDLGSSNQTFQFVKINVYLENCLAQYGLIDDTFHWTRVETPEGPAIFKKVYMFSFDNSTDNIYDNFAPLVDLHGNFFCVRRSYRQEPLTIHPVEWMSWRDFSEDLLYNYGL